MNKEHILSEIKRCAEGNGGIPLGIDRFREETGIRKSDWYGIFWAKWTDAQAEAGFDRNRFGASPIDEQSVLEQIAGYTRELGHFPSRPEFSLLNRRDSKFPAIATLRRRLGNKPEMISRVLGFCRAAQGWDDVIDMCLKVQSFISKELPNDNISEENTSRIGYVYLLQHGNRKEFKIGKTYNLLRREGEIRLELPKEVRPVHTIKTDDPSGIETYWHNRFKDKRLRNEWFELSADDIKAFKKRKFM